MNPNLESLIAVRSQLAAQMLAYLHRLAEQLEERAGCFCEEADAIVESVRALRARVELRSCTVEELTIPVLVEATTLAAQRPQKDLMDAMMGAIENIMGSLGSLLAVRLRQVLPTAQAHLMLVRGPGQRSLTPKQQIALLARLRAMRSHGWQTAVTVMRPSWVEKHPAPLTQDQARSLTNAWFAQGPIQLSKHLPSTSEKLFDRQLQIRRLNEAWDDPGIYVLGLIAPGGVGKTAIINTWFGSMAGERFKGAQRVYAWSFHSQDSQDNPLSSPGRFMLDALRWFGEKKPGRFRSPQARGRQLADLVRKQKTLIILDGIERLQRPRGDRGSIWDKSMQAFLEQLAAKFENGLCVVTSRERLTDLGPYVDQTVHMVNLEQLPEDDAVKLLRHLGVHDGSDEEVRHLCREFDGHALALTLLGNFLREARHGSLRFAVRRGTLSQADQLAGGKARRVLEKYEQWHKPSSPEMAILRLLGLFDGPASGEILSALRKAPRIAGLTDRLVGLSDDRWNTAVSSLRSSGLIDKPSTDERGMSVPDTLDTHALVREYFGSQIRRRCPRACRAAHKRLFKHYLVEVPQKPQTLAAALPVLEAIRQGCEAGCHRDALAVYRERIVQGQERMTQRSIPPDDDFVVTLTHFFKKPWTQVRPAVANDNDGPFLLHEIAHYLFIVGRLEDAVAPMMASLAAHKKLKRFDEASRDARLLREIFLTRGDLDKSLEYALAAVDFADRAGDPLARTCVSALAALGQAYSYLGKSDLARQAFEDAEVIEIRRMDAGRTKLKSGILIHIWGFWYCEHLLRAAAMATDGGQREELLTDIERRVETSIKCCDEGANQKVYRKEFDRAHDHLTLAQVELLRIRDGRNGEHLSKAIMHADEGIEQLDLEGQQHHLANGLLVRAEVLTTAGKFSAARDDLDRTIRIAQRGGMKLYETGAILGLARLCAAEYEQTRVASLRADAQNWVAKAENTFLKMNYRRLDGEIADLWVRLGKPLDPPTGSACG